MIFFVATPIGNLEDITLRALSTLRSVDEIVAEDTRRAKILLDHFQIQKPLLSCPAFREKTLLPKLLQKVQSGKTLAFLSDAGTPCINDPGYLLLQMCLEKKIPFDALPGPCSPIQALVLSGLPSHRFQYLGFLPKNPKKSLLQALGYPGTTIALESPKRIVATLEVLASIDPDRPLALARELTKKFQEILRGTASSLLSHFATHPPLGEMILLLQEGPLPIDISLETLLEMLQTLHGLPLKEAIPLAATLTRTPKRYIYRATHLK